MISHRHWILLTIVLSVFCTETASAQIFGPRNVGRNATRRTDMKSAGTLAQSRRFVRGERAATDFVGADKAEAAAFVGNTMAVNDGEVTSTVVGLREEATPRVNRRRVRSRGGLYAERLSVKSLPESVNLSNTVRVRDFSNALIQFRNERRLDITTAPNGATAAVAGTVASKHERDIAEILLLLEPSVSTVDNQLQVAETK